MQAAAFYVHGAYAGANARASDYSNKARTREVCISQADVVLKHIHGTLSEGDEPGVDAAMTQVGYA